LREVVELLKFFDEALALFYVMRWPQPAWRVRHGISLETSPQPIRNYLNFAVARACMGEGGKTAARACAAR
jgi:hypothetical protein